MGTKAEELWVVYRVTAPGVLGGSNAVREQGEWEEMQRQQPGHRTLTRKGIASEAEAERVAREEPRGAARP
jgi:hypothetical protein